jgi:hypothetical protein
VLPSPPAARRARCVREWAASSAFPVLDSELPEGTSTWSGERFERLGNESVSMLSGMLVATRHLR